MRMYGRITASLNQRLNTVFENFEPVFPYIGYFAIIWHILAYTVWKYLIPQPFESLEIRILNIVLALPLVFYPLLKSGMTRFFTIYYLFYVLFVGPCFFFYMTMKNGWDEIWLLSSFTAIPMTVVICYDWLFMSVLMTVAYITAQFLVVLETGSIFIPEMKWAYITILFFAVTFSFVATSWLRFRHEQKIELMKSLSGTIAHEMRNPLASITLAIDALRTMLPDTPVEEVSRTGAIMLSESTLFGIQEIIDRSAQTINRSNKVIDSILASLKGSEISRKQFRNHQASSCIRAAVDIFAYEDPGENELITLDLAHDFEFFGDRDLLSHMLFNLLDNALYYRREPGFSIDIITEKIEHGNRIIVRDTGPGVPHNRLETIFNQFYSFGKAGGNGLGLAFCRRIAESFGGTIVCRSIVGEWTEFVIDLPDPSSPLIDQFKQELLSAKLILVVDDQVVNRMTLSRILSEMNCSNDQAENGRIALEMAAKKAYDLIFMDIEMPVLSGDAAAKYLRAGNDIDPAMAAHYREIPIIAVTALPPDEAIRRSLMSGIDDYIFKPVIDADVRKMVNDCFFAERPEKEAPPVSGGHSGTILLADDNIMTRQFLKLFLEPVGYRIIEADDGRKAIEVLEVMPVDLVILDLEMPVMGGMETARAIRRQARFRRLPLISLSGHTDRQTDIDAMNAGIDIHLGKPVRKHELERAISRLLTRRAFQENQGDEASPKPCRIVSGEMTGDATFLDESIVDGLLELGASDLPAQLFDLFEKDSERLLSELRDAFRIRDREAVLRVSHTLKGSAAYIGAARISSVAAKMDEEFRQNRCSWDEDWSGYLEKLRSHTAEAFFDYLAKHSQARNGLDEQ